MPGLPAIDFHDLANLLYLVAGFALLSYLLLDQLIRSPIGETLTAIREDEVSAASLGINCGAWKVFAFGVGSAVAGAAGCFYASFVGTLVPDAFFITESFTILAMVVVGGMGTLIGPVCGAILLTVLPEFLRGIGDLRLDRLRRRGHAGGAVHSRRHRPGGAARVRTAAARGAAEHPMTATTSARVRSRRRAFCAPNACTRASAAFMRCAISRSPYRWAPSSPSSDPTAPANPRCSTC